MDAIHYILLAGGALLLFLIGGVWQIVNGRIAQQSADINRLRDQVQSNKEEVLREYVSYERLKETLSTALQPLRDDMERIEGHITELFHKLEGKQDKG